MILHLSYLGFGREKALKMFKSSLTEGGEFDAMMLVMPALNTLYCTVLYCTVLYCHVLYCTVLYCTVHHSFLFFQMLFDSFVHISQLFFFHL